MHLRWSLVAMSSLALVACRTTKPGTHVEVMDEGGAKVYVAGAAGPGMNQGIACDTAVNRSVAAIALRFAQDNDDIEKEVASDVGVENGKVFIERYARAKLQSAAVQDTKFNPADHLCMATVRWTPPVFVKDAIKEYAEQLKSDEYAAMHPKEEPAPVTAPAETPPSSAPVASSGASGSPSVAPTPTPAEPPVCPKERGRLKKADEALQKATDELNECLRRTSDNTTTCHRYQLYVDQAQAKQKSANDSLTRCQSR